MTVWKAKRVYRYAYIAAGLLTVLVIGLASALPRQYVDAVINEKAKETADTESEEKESLILDPPQFRNLLEVVRERDKAADDPAPALQQVKTSVPGERWKQEVTAALKLNGTLLDSDSSKSLAAIIWKKDEEQFYAPGEHILNSEGVEVKGIYSDYIEVGKDGGLLKIELEKYTASAASTDVKRHPSRVHTPQPLPGGHLDRPSDKWKKDNPRLSSRNAFKPRKIGNNRYMLSRRDMASYVDNPSKILTELNVKPQTQNGEPTGGFIITGMKQDALLRKIGLRDGDVIMRVNGQNPMSLMGVITDKTLKDVQVEYVRAGRRQTLHYTIQP
jgi:type II secretory pathway component PulC